MRRFRRFRPINDKKSIFSPFRAGGTIVYTLFLSTKLVFTYFTSFGVTSESRIRST